MFVEQMFNLVEEISKPTYYRRPAMRCQSSMKRRLSKKEVALVFVIIIFSIFSFVLFSTLSQAHSSKQVTTYYISYEIQPGDTLWSIADEYMTPEDHSRSEYISKVKALNHMLSDDIIAGNYIIISYNDYE